VERSGGHVTTFEIDPNRAAQARGFFRQAGVESQITVVEGDAHKNIAAVKGPVDLVFLDADKPGYPDYLKQVLPLVRPGGLILAHNVASAPEYLEAVAANPELETIQLTQGSGLSATLKKR
jgi:predicted O-methyltransferase YrrM